MRHRKKFNHLSRKSAHRKAMLANMATSLIMHKRIHTTVAKAKALRTYIEPLITRSKEDTTHSRRVVFSYLQSKEAITELFREISVKVADRPGGYTRIIKIGNRLGDNAEMCMMELVDFNENLLAEKDAKKAKPARRRRKGGKKKTAEDAVAEPAVEEISEEAETKAKAELKEEVKAEVETEEVKAEVKAEEIKEEVKEEVKDEVKAEEEAKVEAPVDEEKKEEVKSETDKSAEDDKKEEPKAEEKKEDNKEESK
ncbi:MAG: 50S ribosomal protein L17 [Bacteroidetes bacterium]|nr:50S ribosomal protein L17 [Bacteroidota bacterium]